MAKKSIVDSLVTNNDEQIIKTESIDEYIPETCMLCDNTVICSPLLTFMSLAKWGISIEIKECTYNKPTKG